MTAPIFYPFKAPLNGINLIEASAGTGKTSSLATLFVRFLLGDAKQPPLAIHQILVVTFTKAATAELYTRFQKKIKTTLSALQHGAKDKETEDLLAPYREDAHQMQLAKRHLLEALNQFDQAAIYTIHGFCQRILSHYEPANHTYELLTDDTLLLNKLVADFWRTHVLYDAHYAQLVIEEKLNVEKMLKVVRPYIGKPYLEKPNLQSASDEAVLARQSLSAAWHKVWQHLEAGERIFWFLQQQKLNKNRYREKSYQALFFWLSQPATKATFSSGDQLLDKAQTTQPIKKVWLEKLRPAALADCIEENEAVHHPFFVAIAQLLDADLELSQIRACSIDVLRLALIDWIDEKLTTQIDQPQRRMDSLVIDLMRLLQHHPSLGKEIADIWHVALIDEFQDTDPVQYAIFQQSFIQHGESVFLVGDPKQAIYSFRGADIFTYLVAKQQADRHYTLTKNYRSSQAVVSAINALFERSQAFLLDIPFLPAQASEPIGQLADGYSAMVWHWLTSQTAEEETNNISRKQMITQAAAWTARRIAELLSSKPLVEEKSSAYPLCARDIAVLVATHAQGAVIRDALAKYNIASSSLTNRNVFDSAEADDMLALLQVWRLPGDRFALHTALATEIIGLDAAAIYTLEDTAQERYRSLFFEAHQRWLNTGPMAAWRFYMRADRVAERLLPLVDGERRLTNLMHLMELAQQHSIQTQSSMTALVTWFMQSMHRSSSVQDQQERLDSDQDLVRIVTIHAAKGMQYPVVFCPFLWHAYLDHKTNDFWLYHIDDKACLATTATVNDDIKRRAQNERFAEEIRKLYVALTRAKLRIEVCWGAMKDIVHTPLAWLLCGDALDPIAVETQLKTLTQKALHDQWATWVGHHANHMSIRYADYVMPNAPLLTQPSQAIVMPPTSPVVLPAWQIASFSRLADTFSLGIQATPDDEAPALTQIASPPTLIHADFPKGTRAGRCLHDVLETVDFSDTDEQLYLAIDRVLMRHAFSQTVWRDEVYRLVSGVLDAPLKETYSLRGITRKARLTEMAFLLPLKPLKVTALQAILANPSYQLHPAFQEASYRLDFEQIKGYIKGFIDLVVSFDHAFYVIDYKSHYLGDQTIHYAQHQLIHVMAQKHYYLQYLIYLVALRAYLKSRGLPVNIGGIRYLFVRGLDRLGHGIWSDTPSEALLQALEQLFYGEATASVH
ncbi:MAG: exodeoxyribonuclease V subunit beta [Neisseriales bacterium]|nr:MAG: exodeoxyribonuclease V subunit beta [Neisseriales bacterium]